MIVNSCPHPRWGVLDYQLDPAEPIRKDRHRAKRWRRVRYCHDPNKTVARPRKKGVFCPVRGSNPRVLMAKSEKPVTIKKYANRRLYNTGTSTYVTLEDLAALVKEGEDFLVYDAKTGDDITRSVLAQIIFEQENKAGQNLLPTTFLRQLIRFYGDSMQMVVPKYLEQSIDTLTREQEKFRKQLTNTFSGTPFAPLEEHVRRNMELFQQTFSMFKPFVPPRSGTTAAPSLEKAPEPAPEDTIDDLRRQMKEMQDRLERMSNEPKKEE